VEIFDEFLCEISEYQSKISITTPQGERAGGGEERRGGGEGGMIQHLAQTSIESLPPPSFEEQKPKAIHFFTVERNIAMT
jgi:hypothetical protein